MRLSLGVAAVAVVVLGLAPSGARALEATGASAPDGGPAMPALSEHDAALRAAILKEAEQASEARLKEMKEELREEVRAEVTTASVTPQELEAIPIEKPRLQFFELNGYFRVRPALYNNLTLGWSHPDPMGYYLFPRDFSNAGTRSAVSADLRLRLDPTLNVSEGIRVKAQIDVLNNLVLGSTPGGAYGNFTTPGGQLFSQTQNPPTSAGDVFRNSVQATRAWAEVETPVGELRFGRMGSQWGLGMYQNDGNCLDCDYGNTVDRIAFAAKIADHYVIPMLDFSTSGPLYNPYAGDPLGQPIAFDHGIAAYEYGLVLAKKDTDEELKKKQEAGSHSINYGFYGVWRLVDHEAVGYGDDPAALANFYGPTGPPNTLNSNYPTATKSPNYVDVRSASLLTPDVWFRYQTRRFRVEAEAIWVTGNFKTHWYDPVTKAPDTTSHLVYVNQFGGALQSEYHLLSDGALRLGFDLGLASGDNSPGFGNHPERGPTNGPGSIDGLQYNCSKTVGEPCPDNTINNFSFNRDYRIDLILWRQLLGGVTDAFYLKPGISYALTDGLNISFTAVYSQALHVLSTPGGAAPLGLELDTGIHFNSDDGFIATFDYGILFPFAGLGEIASSAGPAVSASIAQTVRLLLGVRY
jgi:uncharacterized protein (TIGR04551 family)